MLGDIRESLEQEVAKKGVAYRDFMKTATGVWERDTQNNTHQKKIESLQLQLTDLEMKKVATESRIRIMNRADDESNGKRLSDLARLALIDDDHVARLEMLLAVKVDAVTERSQSIYPERQEYANARFRQLSELFLELSLIHI